VLVDAFRHDYLDPRETPVMAALAQAGAPARLRPILGYSDSIRATIFTGGLPDEHGYWMEYCRRPGDAPLRGLARLSALDRLRPEIAQRVIKLALSQTVARRVARRRGYDKLSLRHLPFRALGQFDWTLRRSMEDAGALGVPTVFDELSAAGIRWTYLDAARDGTRGLLRGLDALAPDTRFVFVYLHHIDMASHVLGLSSPLFRRVVRRTDRLVGEVVERFTRRLGQPRLLTFSDHGMSQVHRTVSYPDLWTHPAFPDRFCFALDATMVRLWFDDHDPRLRAEIRRRVAAGAPGRFLSSDERVALHLDFGDRLYGDEIYLLEPGVAIFPNFHSMQRPKAMHAYHPDDPDQQGVFIAPAGEQVGPVVELTDVHRWCRRLAGLPPSRSDRGLPPSRSDRGLPPSRSDRGLPERPGAGAGAAAELAA
jgi:hypothetical protein